MYIYIYIPYMGAMGGAFGEKITSVKLETLYVKKFGRLEVCLGSKIEGNNKVSLQGSPSGFPFPDA